MEKKLKVGLLVGGGAIVVLTSFFLIRNKVKKNTLNKPCKGRKCAKGIVGEEIIFSGDKANIRSTTSIDNKDNLIGTVTNNPIGTVVKEVIGGDGFVWYQVSLDQSLNGKELGFVREDVITVYK